MRYIPVSGWLCRPELHVFLERMTRVNQTIPPVMNFFSLIITAACVEFAASVGILGALTDLVFGWHCLELSGNGNGVIY